ncbi:MAG: YdeI/OmpD-associated family protein [Prevotellaceae bacterium]|nr:YdeI/OmpD-associated family protein [Prevotellaceae bacterium]
MTPDTVLNFQTRAEWRDWLQQHFDTENEAWLVYARKASGGRRILYNDAVEEALCVGWIDSTYKKIDDSCFVQRFTPRNRRSSYSQPNKERLKWLLEHNLIHPSFLKTIREIISKEFVFPSDILEEIKKDGKTWENYLKFSEPYKRIRIAYIDAARKRPDEFRKRLSNFLQKTHDNKLIAGFGGIEKYY